MPTRSYRIILKHLNRLPTTKNKDSNIRAIIAEAFREGKHIKDEKEANIARENIKNYALMIESIQELRRLRYLDSGEKMEPRQKIQATAARVGLAVPKFSDELKREDFKDEK